MTVEGRESISGMRRHFIEKITKEYPDLMVKDKVELVRMWFFLWDRSLCLPDTSSELDITLGLIATLDAEKGF